LRERRPAALALARLAAFAALGRRLGVAARVALRDLAACVV